MAKKILIIDDVHQLLTEGLAEHGFDVIYKPSATRDDLLHLIGDASGLVVRTKTLIDKEVISASGNLEFIARAGAGTDNIDLEAAMEKKIEVFNAGEANADAVGEHTLGMMIALMGKLNKADQEVRQSIWNREANRGEELGGKVVCIIGFGNTGKAVAKKLSGFDVEVITYDKYLINCGNAYARQVQMDEIFERADLLSLHIPLTGETRGMVNVDYIKAFKKPIRIFNMCRGEVVVTRDLVEAMKEGKVLGAGLDVLENEKLQTMSEQEKEWFSYIAGSDRTVLSPHVAGWTKESYLKISSVLLKKIIDLNLNESVS